MRGPLAVLLIGFGYGVAIGVLAERKKTGAVIAAKYREFRYEQNRSLAAALHDEAESRGYKPAPVVLSPKAS